MKIPVLTFVSLLSISSVFARNTNNIPGAVKSAFEKAYPEVKQPRWEKENADYEASFEWKGKKMSVSYTANGNLIETETNINSHEFPQNALKYASGKGNVSETSKIIKADGTIIYEAEVKHKDLLFDEKGNFITEKKD